MAMDAEKFEATTARLYDIANRLAAELTAKADRLLAMSQDDALWSYLYNGETMEDVTTDSGSWPAGPMKYVLEAQQHISGWQQYLPHLEGLSAAYEIGVGPAYLFAYMQQVFGTRMSGCDVDLHLPNAYQALRRALGVADAVVEHRVTRQVPTPVTPGSEAVLAFWIVFNKDKAPNGTSTLWTREDHEWFLRDIAGKLTGPRLFICRYNHSWLSPKNQDVVDFYNKIGRRPIGRNKRFYIVDLHQFL